MAYLWAFLIGFGFDLVPIIGPPVWTGLVWLLVKFDLNPWLVLIAGVPGSVLGRYVLSLYIPWFSRKFLKRRKNDDLEFVGRRIKRKRWQSGVFVLVYSLSPLPTTPLFSAAGMAKVPAILVIPPFFVGKFISDAVMLFTGRQAVSSLADLFHGTFSTKGVLVAVGSVLVICGFLFLDWRQLFDRKRVRFNVHIWK